MKKILLLSTVILLAISAKSQYRSLVYFTDKGNTNPSLSPEQFLSKKSLERRAKNNAPFDNYDLPVNRNYLKQLKSVAKVVSTSKWLNAALVESQNSPEELLHEYPFIKRIEEIKDSPATRDKFGFEQLPYSNINSGARAIPSYGHAELQNKQIGTDCLHDQGFLGDSVIIAVIDAGWPGADTIPYFDSLFNDNRLLDTYNFIDMDTMVFQKYFHGTAVSSLMLANYPDSFVGTAPHAQYLFYITEDVTMEVHQEEYNLVMGLERADSIGADVVSISLGYFKFDTLQGDYTYADMDGQTTICTQGVQVATSKGLIVVTSAGNSGPGHIGAPGDADSILCVGATDTVNAYASFSSVGPSYDGRVKPDIAAVGKKAAYVKTNGEIGYGNGTSFSCPLSAGMVACLVHAHPMRTAQEIIQAVRTSSHQQQNPDTLFGYGIPNACIADSILTLMDMIDTTGPGIQDSPQQGNISVYPNPASSHLFINAGNDFIQSIQVYSLDGKLIIDAKPEAFGRYRLDISRMAKGLYLSRVLTSNRTNYLLFGKVD